STAQSIHVEVCAQCHPYFTGKQRLVDTAGRVDRFRGKSTSETAPAKAQAVESRLRQALARAEEVAHSLADPDVARDPSRLKSLGREHVRLAPVVKAAERLPRLKDDLEQAREMAQEADPELVALAKADLARLPPAVS